MDNELLKYLRGETDTIEIETKEKESETVSEEQPAVCATESTNTSHIEKKEKEPISTSEENCETVQNKLPPQQDSPNDDEKSPAWAVSLATVNGQLPLTEFGHAYLFKEVVYPESDDGTKKFVIFYKQLGDSKWVIHNGLLTDRYTVCSVEEFVKWLKTDITFNNEHIRFEPFKLIWCGDVQTITSALNDTQMLVMRLMTGCDENLFDNISVGLNIYIMNTYNGSRSISLNHGIKMNVLSKKDGKEYSFNDMFTLMEHKLSLGHYSKLSELDQGIKHVHEHVSEAIDKFKSIDDEKLIEGCVANIAKCLSKQNKISFLDMVGSIQGSYRNLYTIFMVASAIISNNYSITEHIGVSVVAEKLVKTI